MLKKNAHSEKAIKPSEELLCGICHTDSLIKKSGKTS